MTCHHGGFLCSEDVPRAWTGPAGTACVCGTFAAGICQHCGRPVCANPQCAGMVAGRLTCAAGVAEMQDREHHERRHTQQVLDWRHKAEHHRLVNLNRSRYGDDTPIRAQIHHLRRVESAQQPLPRKQSVLQCALAGTVVGLLLWIFADRSGSVILIGLLVGSCVGLAAVAVVAHGNRQAVRASHERRRLQSQVGCGDLGCAICQP